jgi:NADPH:quinone reductase-like Zn-dependent oxidoreductase
VGRIWPGLKVLIVGAGGGIGTFAVQIAESFGARAAGGCHRKAQGYSSGMKTVSPIPEDLFDDGPRLARALKKPRSRLYCDAVCDADAALTGTDFAAAAARRVFERSVW